MAAAITASSSGPRYAPEDPTLPKPWKGLVDGKTGYLYYWNPDTNVTQYERPTGSAPTKLSSVPISSLVHVQQSSQGQRHGCNPDDDGRYGGGCNVVSKLDAGSMTQLDTRVGTLYSHNDPNGTLSSGHGGSSSRGHGSTDLGNALSTESYRRQHEITIAGDNVPPPFTSFEGTDLPPEILREVHNAGFSAPTPIQAQSWPVALQSRDIVAIAKTGSGKTLGYLIPGFIHLKRCRKDPRLGPSVLVLSPTRELATQIQVEASKFGKSSRISCTCLYGGAPKGPQLRDIDRGADIVVATPGRLNDILEMKRISLHQVSYLVLDEADRMLDMGFEPQIRKIVKEVPTRRQTLMYTATWPKEVRKIAADLLVNPVQINIGNVDELVANKSITQHVEVLAPMEKQRRLEQILRSQDPGSKIIIFCSTKKMCDQLTRNITRQFGAAAIHGDKSQGERDYVLSQFRTGRTPVLVATDVAARGLDIKDIRMVINYDFPTGVEDYVHRIGRTGRAGATGLAYTFFAEQDVKHASDLIKVLEGAKQHVPPEIRDMASRGAGMSRFSRWGSGAGGRGGRNDSNAGGRGGRGFPPSSSSRLGRGGGRGYEYESRDRYDRRYHDGHDSGRSRSRSPPGKGSSWGNHTKSFNPNSSPSYSPNGYDRALARDRSPGRSFQKTMTEWDRSPPLLPKQHVSSYDQSERKSSFGSRSPYRKRSPSPYSRDARKFSGGLVNGGYSNGNHSSYLGDEDEEGMIPQDA